MIRFDDLIAKTSTYMPDPASVALIQKAYVYSATVHRNRFTATGTPMLQHSLEVANLLADLKLDVRCIVAGLLHDVVEDALADPAALRQIVGDDVAQLVEEVARLAKASYRSSEAMRAQHMREMILASTRDLRVILLVLADRLQTLRAAGALDVPTREALARETLAIYAPIAHRLGVHAFKADLEDLSFQLLEPVAYAELKQAVNSRLSERLATVDAIRGELLELLAKQGLTAQITGRLKHLYSIHTKMQQKGVSLDGVQDLLATRILVPTTDDCYRALGAIHAQYTPLPGRFKDYIALPKANGYQSLHTSVFFGSGDVIEIQIRTVEMHREAELGIAAHFVYKDGASEGEKTLASVGWFRKLLDNLEEGKDPQESMELLERDLTPDEIFVFTPTGEVIKLPTGATPIDFAYAVHSKVGEHCTGARMNGRMVSIRTPLRNGAVVEILTSQKQAPKEDWLKVAVSSRALSKIRAYIRQEERQRALEKGKELVARECKRVGKKLEDLMRLDEVQEWMRKNGMHGVEDLLAAEGLGQHSLRTVLDRLALPGIEPPPVPVRKVPSRASGQGASGQVIVAGMENMMTRFAKCCAPVLGDALAGIVTRGRGVSVHRSNCATLARYASEPGRRVQVEWADSGQEKLVTLAIRTTSSMTRLIELVSVIEEQAGLAIVSGRIASKQGVYTQHLTVRVSDARVLNRILQRLNAMAGVRAERVLESA
jgi:GTP diphosphokinase / guanosine-3',5'-bis(diphosphate) 3'-diphosphatase